MRSGGGLASLLVALVVAAAPGAAPPEGQMYAPIWQLGFIHAQGPRVAESGLGLITGWTFSAPYEDVKLKPR